MEKLNFISVNNDCLNAKFPTVALTELQINPTDATGSVPANLIEKSYHVTYYHVIQVKKFRKFR